MWLPQRSLTARRPTQRFVWRTATALWFLTSAFSSRSTRTPLRCLACKRLVRTAGSAEPAAALLTVLGDSVRYELSQLLSLQGCMSVLTTGTVCRFNVFVAQPEVKPGCVLRRSNIGVLESKKLVTDNDVCLPFNSASRRLDACRCMRTSLCFCLYSFLECTHQSCCRFRVPGLKQDHDLKCR